MGPLSIAASLGGAGGVAIGAAAVIAWSFSPWGAETKLTDVRADRDAKVIELKVCRGINAGIEKARSDESGQARDDFDAIQRQCATAARASVAQGIQIGKIVNRETQLDESGAPRRSIIGAGELRDAIGQPAPRP